MNIIQEDINNIIDSEEYLQNYKNNTILISGANGMIPSYFVFTLLELNRKYDTNIKVIALVRNITKAKLKFEKYLNDKNLSFLVQDVCDEIDIEENINIIIHAASQASPKYYGIDPVGTLNANVIGTNNLLKLAKEKNVSEFLFLSTSEVYGQPKNPSNINENDYGYLDILNVRSCYAESKRLAETMCISWQHQYGIPIKIARIFHTYGPGMLLDDGRVFADFVENIVNNKDIIMNSDGSAKRPFCYISDSISAMFKIIHFGKVGNAYNIANIDEYISIKNLAQTLTNLYPNKNLNVIFNNNDLNDGYIKSSVSEAYPCINKIKSLGWKPCISIKEGFKKTIDSFNEI